MRRGFPLSDTVYILGNVYGVPVNYVLDTGAEKTVVSEKIYNKIKDSDKPTLYKKGKLMHAGGEPINDFGKCNARLEIES